MFLKKLTLVPYAQDIHLTPLHILAILKGPWALHIQLEIGHHRFQDFNMFFPFQIKDENYFHEHDEASEKNDSVASKAKDASFKCTVCSATYQLRQSLTRHMQQHQETSLYWCRKCTQSFKDESKLKDHIAAKHEQKHTCTDCGKEFGCKSSLNTHMKKHSGEEVRYPCLYLGCKRSFNRASILQDHMNAHLNVKPYSCEHCHRKYASRYTWLRHQRECNGTSDNSSKDS